MKYIAILLVSIALFSIVQSTNVENKIKSNIVPSNNHNTRYCTRIHNILKHTWFRLKRARTRAGMRKRVIKSTVLGSSSRPLKSTARRLVRISKRVVRRTFKRVAIQFRTGGRKIRQLKFKCRRRLPCLMGVRRLIRRTRRKIGRRALRQLSRKIKRIGLILKKKIFDNLNKAKFNRIIRYIASLSRIVLLIKLRVRKIRILRRKRNRSCHH